MNSLWMQNRNIFSIMLESKDSTMSFSSPLAGWALSLWATGQTGACSLGMEDPTELAPGEKSEHLQ